MKNLKRNDRNDIRSRVDGRRNFKRKNPKNKKLLVTRVWDSVKEFFRTIFNKKTTNKKDKEWGEDIEKERRDKWGNERKNQGREESFPQEKSKKQDLEKKQDVKEKVSLGSQTKVKTPILGTVNYASSQFAFVAPEGAKDGKENIFVKKIDLKGALQGDTVRVITISERWRTYEVGFVREIVRRANEFFVGTLCKKNELYYVIPNGGKAFFNINVSEENIKKTQAYISSRVKVKVLKYPQGDDNLEGEIVEVLGKAWEHETEMCAILEEFNVRAKFEQPVLDYVKQIEEKIPESEYIRRLDYRSVFTVTIDPVTAKDYDDALSIQKMQNGHYEIGVHIADVSYYVKEGSVLDEEAYQRNTSIYLIDRTIPMLPEKLCNNLCSLVPNKDRLTMSIIFEIDLEGKIYNKWIGETIIYSDERLTYRDSQDIIDKKYSHRCEEPISILYEISKKLREERLKNGGINFEFNNVEFSIDEKDQKLICNISNELESHRLVEEFMLLANRYIAKYAFNLKNKLSNHKSPVFVYRAHDCPEDSKLYMFNDTIKKYGYSLESLRKEKLSSSLNNFLKKINDKPEAEILRQLAIRVMPKAFYTTQGMGHFGLAFEHYSHFTSPIRRYPDVIIHRLLKKYLDKKYIFDAEAVEEKCKYALQKEKESFNVERASLKLKQIEAVRPLIGEVVNGCISNIYEWCMYVTLIEQHCDGIIQLSEIKNDIFTYNKEKMELVGKYTGTSYKLGDKIRVKIQKCDIEKRLIELNFAYTL
ncbi:MAG: VacB/RNase II family 3'-5' exoribonuclease [Cytophagales bacterium]|jgi:ribonuclease R|nr:VacB/RNase II family 3'-5' exoribonuclease [Cytophagales bacterium]